MHRAYAAEVAADKMIEESEETEILGIDLAAGNETQVFRWFLACLLFGKPVQRTVARKAYHELTTAGIDSLDILANYDWAKLVGLLDRAHYVRYDFSTASKLIEIAQTVRDKYGSVNGMLKSARSRAELEKTLTSFKGIGPKTSDIFLNQIIANGLK